MTGLKQEDVNRALRSCFAYDEDSPLAPTKDVTTTRSYAGPAAVFTLPEQGALPELPAPAFLRPVGRYILSPGAVIETYKKPNWLHRWWTWRLLGWAWEDYNK